MIYFCIIVVCFFLYKFYCKLYFYEHRITELQKLISISETDIEETDVEKTGVRQVCSELITITVYLNVPQILLYFFPNSFETDKAAYDYFLVFCDKAKNLGEKPEVYSGEYFINNGMTLDISLDMVSGQSIVWNYKNNNRSIASRFNFFNYNEIKNEELKKEIEQLYIDNWEFLESIGACDRWSNGNLHTLLNFDITPEGICKYSLAADYNRLQHWINSDREKFSLPTNNILCSFREAYTHYLNEQDCEQLKENIKSKLSKDIWRFEINFQRNYAEIANKFVHIFLDVNYGAPVETLTNNLTGREYKYVYPFKVEYYK